MGLKRILGATFATLALVGPAWGGVLATDGFETYSAGQLADATGNAPAGGTGIWTTPWQVDTGLVQWASVVSRSMSYSNGSVHVSGGTQALQIKPTNGAISSAQIPIHRSFTTQDSPTSTLYMSYLLDVPTVSGANNTFFQAGFRPDSTADPLMSAIIQNNGSSQSAFSIRTGPTNSTPGALASTSTTYLLVLEINKSGVQTFAPNNYYYTDLKLFINPTSNVEGDQTSIALGNHYDMKAASDFVFRTARLVWGDAFYVDNMTLGTTFAAVVPEPASIISLMGVGGLALFRRRRRGSSGGLGCKGGL